MVTDLANTREGANDMSYGHLDMLIAYTRLVAASSIIVAVSPTWSLSSEASDTPFTNIIKSHEDCGFYFDNERAGDINVGPKIWDTWNSEDRDELIRAVTKNWKSLSDLATENFGQSNGSTYTNLRTATETILIHHSQRHSPTTTNFLEQEVMAVEEQREAWRISIMATQRESLVRLAAHQPTYRDWVLVLQHLNSVSSYPAVPHSMIPRDHEDVIFPPDDEIRRPSLATNISTSSTSSKMTHSSLKSSGSGGSRRIEIKGGVPLPIRAASESIKFSLPPDNSRTVPTPSSGRMDSYRAVEETISDQGHVPVTEKTVPAPHSLEDEVSDEATVWDDGSVAPVNPEDLVNLAINSPIGMVLATPELRLYWVNERWYDITKVKHGQDLNTWIDGIHPDSMPTLMEVLQGLMQDKVKRTGDIRWKHDSWSTFTAQVLVNAEGNVTAVAATIDDCTQRKTLELAQIEALKEQEATARRIAEQASLRAKELAEWQLQTKILEQRTKEFAQMAEISSIALTCAKPDGELIWGKPGRLKG